MIYDEIIRQYPFDPDKHLGRTYQVVKENKRLSIRGLEDGKKYYCLPDFLRSRLVNRDKLKALAEAMGLVDPTKHIKLIVAFESSL